MSLRSHPRVLFSLWSIPLAIALFVAAGPVVEWFGARYRIGIDPQTVNSLPWTAWVVDKNPIDLPARGDLVQIRAKGLEPRFPDGMPMVKLVAALPGDSVVVVQDRLFVNGDYWGRLWLLSTLGIPSGAKDGAWVVPPDQLVVMGTTAESFDARYYGGIQDDQVVGRARALW